MKTGLPGLMFAVARLLSPWNNIACWAGGLWADQAAGHSAPSPRLSAGPPYLWPAMLAGPKENLLGRLGNSSQMTLPTFCNIYFEITKKNLKIGTFSWLSMDQMD